MFDISLPKHIAKSKMYWKCLELETHRFVNHSLQQDVTFFLSFSLSLISLSRIVIFPFSVPSFHFFILPVFLHLKLRFFCTKIVIFISDFMTTISYLRFSPSLHFYIVFLVEEYIKVVILISKLSQCRFIFFVTSNNTKV